MIRPATLNDLDALVALENRCFTTDRLSRRSFRYMLTKAKAATLVDVHQGALRGYVLVLFHAGTSLARNYSIAVSPEAQGQGVGRALMEAAEREALAHGCVYMRLEVRPDNEGAIQLYRKLSYRQFGTLDDYYEDHMAALRFEKLLAPHLRPDLVRVPFYEQTLDFTCGPSALMMAMKALDAGTDMSRTTELRIWRESTTIFMTAGHGGCGPHGLALSAERRGFGVEIYVKDDAPMFVDSVRSEEKKEVIRLVQTDFVNELRSKRVKIHHDRFGVEEMRRHFDEGAIPVVLISSYRIYHEKFPHWVVVTGFDERFVYVHDSFVDHEKGKTRMDCINMPILQSDFDRMARYGRAAQRAALILRRGRGRRPAGTKA
jgi:ribosomal protein S18 acetylase RimI-like enzyme